MPCPLPHVSNIPVLVRRRGSSDRSGRAVGLVSKLIELSSVG